MKYFILFMSIGLRFYANAIDYHYFGHFETLVEFELKKNQFYQELQVILVKEKEKENFYLKNNEKNYFCGRLDMLIQLADNFKNDCKIHAFLTNAYNDEKNKESLYCTQNSTKNYFCGRLDVLNELISKFSL